MSLLDDVLESKDRNIWTDLVRMTCEDKTLVAVHTHNLHDYILECKNLIKPGSNVLKDLAPPFKFMWVEWKSKRNNIGVLICDSILQSVNNPLMHALDVFKCSALFFAKDPNEAKVIRFLGGANYFLDKDGNLLRPLPGKLLLLWETAPITQDEEELNKFFNQAMFVPWCAISFLHGRNTPLERTSPIPYKIQKARVDRGHQPLYQFHTLRVGEFKHTKRHPTEIGDYSGKPLHICRGNFHYYGEKYGRGLLFGKYEGKYWVPVHERGDARNGILEKDYDLDPEK